MLIILYFLECQCNDQGSTTFICDVATGKCTCKTDLITGDHCDKSVPGYYNFPDPQGKFNFASEWLIIIEWSILVFCL